MNRVEMFHDDTFGTAEDECRHDWVRDDHLYANVIMAPGCLDETCLKCKARLTTSIPADHRKYAA